jgi:tetratricopeptide (TPR) repeat protein
MIETNVLPEDRKPVPFWKRVGKGIKNGAISALKWGGIAAISPLRIPASIYEHYTEESEKNLKRWVRKDPSNPDLHVRLGNAYRENHDSFKKVESLHDEAKKNLEKAIAEFERAVFLDEDCAEGYYGLSNCHRRDSAKRFDYLRKAVKADPECDVDRGATVAGRLWDFVLAATGSDIEATHVVSNIIGRAYDRYDRMFTEGIPEFVKSEKFKSAVAEYESKMSDSPNSELLAEYARYLRENSFSDVEEFVQNKLEELIQRDPRNSALYYERGKFIDNSGNVRIVRFFDDDSENPEIFNNFLTAYEDPDFNVEDWGFYFKIIEHYLATGDYGKAETAFLRGFGVCPDSPPLDSVQGRWIWTRYKEIRYAKAMIRGNESEAKTATFPEELRKKVDLIGALKVGNLSGLGKMLLGDDDDLDEYYDIKPENRVPLAKELNSLGLYDEAIRTLECMKNRGTEAELLLADSYECKWRETGDIEFLEKAHREIFTYTDMDTCVKRVRFARYLGWPNDLENRSIERAEELAAQAPSGTYGNQLEEIRRHLGENEYFDERLKQADSKTDPEKRADILREVAEQAPHDFIGKHEIRSKLTAAYEAAAPDVERRLNDTAGSLAETLAEAELL